MSPTRTPNTTGITSVTILILSLLQCESKNLQKRNLDLLHNPVTGEQQDLAQDSNSQKSFGINMLGIFKDVDNESASGLKPGLLDYENQTYVIKLEETIDEEDIPATNELPANVYEVNFGDWVEDTVANEEPEQRADDMLHRLMRESLLTVEGSHRIRHGSNRLVRRDITNAHRRPMRDEPVINLPVENQDGSSPGPLSRLIEQETFNMTVDYQEPFHNVERPKLLEIVLLMRSDCTLLPKRIVRWVSGRRGILFECQNGAWVVKYLKRRRRKPRPVSIRGEEITFLTSDMITFVTKDNLLTANTKSPYTM